MDQSLQDELLIRMKKSKYLLTVQCHCSIEKINNGYIGFFITRGFCYKLRVFLLKKEGENKLFQIVFQEAFLQEQKAKDKMFELLQWYQSK